VTDDQNFRFRYAVRSDQLGPHQLFADGESVVVDVVPSIGSVPAARRRVRRRPPGLFGASTERGADRAHADRVSAVRLPSAKTTIWRNTIPLGIYGWADLDLTPIDGER